MPLAILIALVAVPAVILFVLQVNAAFVFLSLCLGSVLVRFAGADAVNLVVGASDGANIATSSIELAVLVAPAVLTILFMMRTVTEKRKYFNVLPAVATGMLLLLLAMPLLPPDLSGKISALPAWQTVNRVQSGVIAGSTLVCLAFLWTSRPKHDKDAKHKH